LAENVNELQKFIETLLSVEANLYKIKKSGKLLSKEELWQGCI